MLVGPSTAFTRDGNIGRDRSSLIGWNVWRGACALASAHAGERVDGPMPTRPAARHATLLAAVFAGLGVTLPFLPPFLAGRGLDPEAVAGVLRGGCGCAQCLGQGGLDGGRAEERGGGAGRGRRGVDWGQLQARDGLCGRRDHVRHPPSSDRSHSRDLVGVARGPVVAMSRRAHDIEGTRSRRRDCAFLLLSLLAAAAAAATRSSWMWSGVTLSGRTLSVIET